MITHTLAWTNRETNEYQVKQFSTLDERKEYLFKNTFAMKEISEMTIEDWCL